MTPEQINESAREKGLMWGPTGDEGEMGWVPAPVCPRCGHFIPNDATPGAYPGAISRWDNKTEVCSQCGQDEALAQWAATRRELSNGRGDQVMAMHPTEGVRLWVNSPVPANPTPWESEQMEIADALDVLENYCQCADPLCPDSRYLHRVQEARRVLSRYAALDAAERGAPADVDPPRHWDAL